ncbi:MAG: DNA gyrase inhibitor YacG [Pontibacterium sp.]
MSTRKVNCPHCQTPVEWTAKSPYKPFCSERCRLIDLGAWANEDYQIEVNGEENDFSTGENPDEQQHTPTRH